MNVSITGKQIAVGEALRKHVNDRLEDGVSKYFTDPMEAHVTFSHEGPFYRTHVSVHVGRGMLMESRGEATDIYESFNRAAEHAEKRLRRQKRKVRNKHG
ncbi:MAG: ribosome-associated translation inhibitor RaiA [Alphaproteobacteria bacterium]